MKSIFTPFAALVVGAGIVITGLNLASPAEAEGATLRQSDRASSAGQNHAMGGWTTGFQHNCVPGFSKAGDKKKNGWTDWYVCSTPVIQCPTQQQDNGLKSAVHPQAIVQVTGGNPDGGTVKFRVQYKCDYSYTVLPEG